MGNISSAFQDALAGQAKAALVEVVAANPRITVSDLSDLVAANPSLGGLTLDALFGAPAPGRGGRAKSNAGAGARKGGRKAGGVHKRNVRTEAGRDAFEAEVLNSLRDAGGDNVAASQLREVLDADPTQLRTALNRLIERGVLTFSGKARGTRYSLA